MTALCYTSFTKTVISSIIIAYLCSCCLCIPRTTPISSNSFFISNLLPAQCVTNHARQMGIQSSLHMPDKVLNFVKDHFLMDSVIRSAPLLLKRSVRYTQIAVHKIQGMERAYDVLFIGTGTVHQKTAHCGYFYHFKVKSLKGKMYHVHCHHLQT